MQVSDAIRGRRAVRDYKAEPVSETIITALIEAAIQAPSAMDRQPWSFCVVRDEAKLSQISERAKAHMLSTSGVGLASSHFAETLGNPEFHIFYHAPALILISATQDGQWGTIDCALAAQNLMLAAYDAGLGTCWIGFAQAWLATAEGKASLGIPEDQAPVAPIIVGHPASQAAHQPRRQPPISWIG